MVFLTEKKCHTEIERKRSGTMQDFSPDTTCTDSLVKRASDFMTLVKNLPVAIYRCTPSPDWRLGFINKEIEEISGYSAHHFGHNADHSYCEIVHPDDLEIMKKTMHERAEEGKFF